jgi:tetratricopeptide (TPR) repeat protein
VLLSTVALLCRRDARQARERIATSKFERTAHASWWQFIWELGDEPGIILALSRLGDIAYLQGDHERAVALIEESLAHSWEREDKEMIAWALKLLGNLAQRQSDVGRATRLLAESLALFQEWGDLLGVTAYLEGMAEVAARQGQPERTVRLFGAAAVLRDALGIPPYPAEQAEYEQHLSAARTQLGERTFDTAWTEGQAMSVEQAIAYALEGDMGETREAH